MTNYSRGHDAEKYAAQWLQTRGYKIIALNWRRKQAEIDIITRRPGGPLTFVEAKYRETASNGGGFDYITPVKLRRMAFAADLWVTENRYEGEYVLAAIELSGPGFAVTGFIEEL